MSVVNFSHLLYGSGQVPGHKASIVLQAFDHETRLGPGGLSLVDSFDYNDGVQINGLVQGRTGSI